ncbi:MAG: hypothetical protein P8188_21075, partial [Gemmatimonadota bacterium]
MCIFRMRHPAFPTLAMMLALVAPLSAQGRWSATVHGGVGFPVGDFADDAGEEAGLATVGFALGSDLAMRIDAVTGLEWLSTIQGITFGVDEDIFGDLAPGASVDLGRYWGALAMTGLRWGADAGGARIHFTGQFAAGAVKAPGAEFSAMGETAELVSSWNPAKGYSVGAGADIGDRLVLDVRYEA